MPAKAIPPARDRLQSRLLVWIGVPVLVLLTIRTLGSDMFPFRSWEPRQWLFHIFAVIAISVIFGAAALLLNAATPAAAACGAMICLLLTWHTGDITRSALYSALTPLLALFILTFAATRAGRSKKLGHGIAESHKGRSAAQVIANLGIAALLTSWSLRSAGFKLGLTFDDVFLTVVLAALAEATADTVSSEIGQAFGGSPFLLTTFRRVEPGTDGAISLLGTLAGVAAAALIAATGAPALGMSFAECLVAFAAGIAGLFFDSLLGATVERKGWIGNDLVNFSSTAFAAALALLAIRFAQGALLR